VKAEPGKRGLVPATYVTITTQTVFSRTIPSPTPVSAAHARKPSVLPADNAASPSTTVTPPTTSQSPAVRACLHAACCHMPVCCAWFSLPPSCSISIVRSRRRYSTTIRVTLGSIFPSSRAINSTSSNAKVTPAPQIGQQPVVLRLLIRWLADGGGAHPTRAQEGQCPCQLHASQREYAPFRVLHGQSCVPTADDKEKEKARLAEEEKRRKSVLPASLPVARSSCRQLIYRVDHCCFVRARLHQQRMPRIRRQRRIPSYR